MNMFEEAEALRGTMKMCKMTQGELAKKLGVSQPYIANKLRLLRLSEGEREMIISASLTERHARAVLRLEDEQTRKSALERISRDSLSVEKTEALIDFLHNGEAPKRICRTDKLHGIESFISTVKSSVGALCSLGVSARHTVSLYGRKTYITICIDED